VKIAEFLIAVDKILEGNNAVTIFCPGNEDATDVVAYLKVERVIYRTRWKSPLIVVVFM